MMRDGHRSRTRGGGPEPCPRSAAALFLKEALPFHALLRSFETALVGRRISPSDVVLDLGCGDGLFAAATFSAPLRYGLDRDREALRLAGRRRSHDRLLLASADRVPLPEGACDVVLANSVLEHVYDLEAALLEIRRVLKRKGRLVMTAPGADFGEDLGLTVALKRIGFTSFARRYRCWFNRMSEHRNLHGTGEWEDLLRRTGLTLVHSETYFPSTAMHWFDILHFVSAPALLTHRLLGRWHPFGRPLLASLWTVLIERLVDQPYGTGGACVFLVAENA